MGEPAADGRDAGAPSADPQAELDEGVVKIILLGDSAVGKSKLVERFLVRAAAAAGASARAACGVPAQARACVLLRPRWPFLRHLLAATNR